MDESILIARGRRDDVSLPEPPSREVELEMEEELPFHIPRD